MSTKTLTASGTGWGPKHPRGTGRPLRLTPKRAETIYAALRQWHHVETAAAMAGIGKATIYDWLRTGDDVAEKIEKGQVKLGDLTPEQRRCMDFSDGVKAALAEAEAKGINWIELAAAKPSQEFREKTMCVGTNKDSGEPIMVTERTVITKPPTWQPAAWLLEHRFADRWATRREISGPAGQAVAVTHDLGPDAKAAIFAKVEQMAANLAALPEAIDVEAVETPQP